MKFFLLNTIILGSIATAQKKDNTNKKDPNEPIVEDTISIPPKHLDPARQALIDEMKSKIENTQRYWPFIPGNSSSLMPYGIGPKADYQSPFNFADSLTIQEAQEFQGRIPRERGRYLAGNVTMAALQGPPLQTMEQLIGLYDNASPFIEIPAGFTNWDKDEAFADDKLTYNHFNFKAANTNSLSIPTTLARTLTGGSTVAGLISAKRLFEQDFSTNSLYSKTAGNQYSPDGYAQFYVNENDELMPLAIQIGGPTGLIYYPNDDKNHWLFAKTVFNCAQASYVPSAHFALAHLIFEPMRVVLAREMSAQHPISTLIEHHFTGLYGANYNGMKVLFSKNTPLDRVWGIGGDGSIRIFNDYLVNYDWQKERIIQKFETDGLNNLKNFRYREDILGVMDAVGKFVESYLQNYYKVKEY